MHCYKAEEHEVGQQPQLQKIGKCIAVTKMKRKSKATLAAVTSSIVVHGQEGTVSPTVKHNYMLPDLSSVLVHKLASSTALPSPLALYG